MESIVSVGVRGARTGQLISHMVYINDNRVLSLILNFKIQQENLFFQRLAQFERSRGFLLHIQNPSLIHFFSLNRVRHLKIFKGRLINHHIRSRCVSRLIGSIVPRNNGISGYGIKPVVFVQFFIL